MTIAIFLGSLLGAMALGVPIAFALLASGVALMWHMDMFDAQILAQNTIEGANSFPLLAVPFFMLAGEIMNAGGLSRRIVNFAMTLVGHVRGGLGYVGIMAAVIMAALSGSAVADAAALAALLLPMMNRAGYDTARSAGLLASASVIAPVIPPSIAFVVFGVAANVSISKLFMAGIAPGLMLGAALWITWWLLVRQKNIAPSPRASRREVLAALRDATFALVLPAIVVVGLKFGVFTPTEAAVVAAVRAAACAMPWPSNASPSSPFATTPSRGSTAATRPSMTPGTRATATRPRSWPRSSAASTRSTSAAARSTSPAASSCSPPPRPT